MEAQLILDRYRPLEDLGAGGFGTVVLAWDTRMQRRVAIKRLPLPAEESGRGRRPAGLAEARTAAFLTHPAIVTVYDFDTDADEAFIIMEYVAGASLGQVLDELGGPLDCDEAAAVLGDVFSAVEFAHDNGVLHLDIKPANVLVTADGHAKVADFGVALLSHATGHGHASGGTLGYAPLEQLRGDAVDERTDEWALGALAYEALTGTNPFDAATFGDAVMRAEVFEVPLPSDYDQALSPELDDAIMTALDPHAGGRFADVRAFEAELAPELGDPALGRETLAEVATRLTAEEAETARAAEDRLGLWDRRGWLRSLGVRVLGAAISGWLAWLGLSALPVSRAASLAGTALVALAGALLPAVGALLGWLALSAGLGAAGFVPFAVVLGALALAYWWLIGRNSVTGALLPGGAPLLGLARVSLLAPLLAGFTLPPLGAAIAGLAAGVVAVAASAASGVGVPYLAIDWRVIADPWHQRTMAAAVAGLLPSVTDGVPSLAPALVLASWPLAAAASSLLSRRATRPAAVAGALAGTAILGGAYWLAGRLAPIPAAWQWAGVGMAASLAASLILMLLVVFLGPPLRAEEEESPWTGDAYDEAE